MCIRDRGELVCDEFIQGDLREPDVAMDACKDIDYVYALAADMGGMGYISTHHAGLMKSNTMININTLDGAVGNGVRRYLFTSSACVYSELLQGEDAMPLKETDAYPAQPDSSYGWEKLYAEQLCHAYMRDYAEKTSMDVRIARFHNIFGRGTYKGGREKAPAALCRKVADAKLRDKPSIKLWGDGEQIRSFCYIDDCLEMLYRLMKSSWPYPLNIGTDEDVTINQLAEIIMQIAGVDLHIEHIEGPQGVRSRNADLTLMGQVLSYEPKWSLEKGLGQVYPWIESHVREDLDVA